MPPFTLAPRINTIAMRDALVSFCAGHASMNPFVSCESELPAGRTINTTYPGSVVILRSIVWKKNLQVVDGPRAAAWCEQEAPSLVWDELRDAAEELPSQRTRQRLKWTVRGLLTTLGADPKDADDRCIQVVDSLRDIFLGTGAYIGTDPVNYRILDVRWAGSFWDPVPRANPLISARAIDLELTAGQ